MPQDICPQRRECRSQEDSIMYVNSKILLQKFLKSMTMFKGVLEWVERELPAPPPEAPRMGPLALQRGNWEKITSDP